MSVAMHDGRFITGLILYRGLFIQQLLIRVLAVLEVFHMLNPGESLRNIIHYFRD